MIPAYASALSAIDRAARAAAVEVSTQAAAKVKDLIATTPDAAGHVGRIDTAAFVESVVAGEPVDRGTYVEARVFSRDNPSKVTVLEDGRRPGKPVSLEGRLLIRKWVERKLGAKVLLAAFPNAKATTRTTRSGKTVVTKVTGVKKVDRDDVLDSVTFLIIRKIRRRGSPGIGAFAKGRAWVNANGAAIAAQVFSRILGGPSA